MHWIFRFLAVLAVPPMLIICGVSIAILRETLADWLLEIELWWDRRKEQRGKS